MVSGLLNHFNWTGDEVTVKGSWETGISHYSGLQSITRNPFECSAGNSVQLSWSGWMDGWSHCGGWVRSKESVLLLVRLLRKILTKSSHGTDWLAGQLTRWLVVWFTTSLANWLVETLKLASWLRQNNPSLIARQINFLRKQLTDASWLVLVSFLIRHLSNEVQRHPSFHCPGGWSKT